MAQIYTQFLSGTLSAGIDDNDLTIDGSALADMAVVAAPNTMFVCLDPDGSAGAPEIVTVTAHTTSATTATITRAAQSTVARAHLISTVFRVAVTKADLDELPFRKLTTTGDMLYGSAANTATRLAIGTTGLPLVSNGTIPAYAKVGTAGIADDAITTDLIANDAIAAVAQLAANVVGASELADDAVDTNAIVNLAVTAAKLASDSVETAKILDANVTNVKIASEAYGTWTPVVIQGVTPSITIQRGKYFQMSRRVTGDCNLTVTSSGTAATIVTVSPPVDPATAEVGTIMGTAIGPDGQGYFLLFATATTMKLGALGVATSFLTTQLVNTNTIRCFIDYEAAA